MRRTTRGLVHLPFEVFDKLKDSPLDCLLLYTRMLARLPIEEDWDQEGGWVVGRIHATKAQIEKAVTHRRISVGVAATQRGPKAGRPVKEQNIGQEAAATTRKITKQINSVMAALFSRTILIAQEVLDAIDQTPCDDETIPALLKVYCAAQRKFPVDVALDGTGQWVTGKISASMPDVVKAAGLPEKILHTRNVCGLLGGSGVLADNPEGGIAMPMLARLQDFIQEAEKHINPLDKAQRHAKHRDR